MHTERSFAAPVILPDAQLEYWAEVYLSRPSLRRIPFERFLARAVRRPHAIVSQCGLLPAQRAAQVRMEFESAIAERDERAIRELPKESHCANGAWTEKTRHHAWPRHRNRTEPTEV